MTERYFQVTPVKVRYFCDTCKNVEVSYTGKSLMTIPPKYVYYCLSCDKEYQLDNLYPMIVYEEQAKVSK